MPSTNAQHVDLLAPDPPVSAEARPNSSSDPIPAVVATATASPAANVSPFFLRLRRAAVPLAVAAGIMAALVLFANLSVLAGAVAFLALAAALLVISPAGQQPGAHAAPQRWAPEQQSDLQTIIDAVPDALIALDEKNVVVAFNTAALAIVPALQVSQHVSIALRRPTVNDAIRRATETKVPQTAAFSDRVPVERWYVAHVAPLRVTQGAGLLVTLRDLTAIHRIEQMRADFVANASHELRTPLAALSGFIDTLMGPARTDAAATKRFLGIMQTQARRMARLIEDLLSLSRLEVSPPVDPAARADLSSILRQVMDALQPLAAERQVQVTITGADTPVQVPGDRDELFRVFENLVENALKYAPSGQRVEIEVQNSVPGQGRTETAVAIRDFGPGIAAEHVPRLTERFYRVSAEQSRAEGGTGLGLALVKHILNRHGGRLKIDSTLGQGSTFTVYLPRTEAMRAIPK